MKKEFKKFLIPLLLFTSICIILTLVAPHFTYAETGINTSGVTYGDGTPGFWANIFENLIATIGTLLLQLMGLIIGLAGAILNGVIYYTIFKVSENYNNLQPILTTWQVIRDIANMSFIFVLLYAGIRTMLGQGGSDTKNVITGVVVAAVLMNFSLFFTRLVIDIANTIALTFYNAIAPNTTDAGFLTWGLSNAFMKHLQLQSLYDLAKNTTIDSTTILTVGVMGSIMLLVAAFTFFAVAIMFIIRYVVLLLVMVLSPIFFLSFALPKDAGIEKYAKQWKDALFGQAFFAPVYFLLVWVSLRLMDGIFQALTKNTAGGDLTAGGFGGLAVASTPSAGTLVTILNFAIVITLLLTSLSVAKSMADKAGGGMSKITSWATGKAGGITFGFAGGLGRNTIGRAGAALGENDRLKNTAANGNFASRFLARQTLQTSRSVGSASLDLRGAGLGGKDAGKASGKGGYSGYIKKKAEDEEKFAKTLGASDKTIKKAEVARNQTQEIDIGSMQFANEHKEATKAQSELTKELGEEATRRTEEYNKYVEDVRTGAMQPVPEIEEVLKKKMDEAQKKANEAQAHTETIATPQGYKDTKIASAQRKVDELKGVNDDRAKEILRARGEETSKVNIARVKKENPSAGDARKKAFADSVENSIYAKARGYNYAAASKIRKGKSNSEQLTDIVKKMNEEEKSDEGVSKKEEPKGESGGTEGGEKKEEGGEAPKSA